MSSNAHRLRLNVNSLSVRPEASGIDGDAEAMEAASCATLDHARRGGRTAGLKPVHGIAAAKAGSDLDANLVGIDHRHDFAQECHLARRVDQDRKSVV